jgi:Eukaryotic aspartyl protease
MITQNDITGNMELFTANLGSWRDASDPDKGESFYTFGFIDQPTVTASGMEPAYTPVDNSQGFWMFDSASFSINGETTTQSGNTAIADTGTTLALVSDAMCKALYAAIPGSSYNDQQQGYIFPSDTTADNLPVVQVAVGNTLFTINKEDLSFADAGNNMVYGGIQSRGSMTFDILGDTFLKSIYAVSTIRAAISSFSRLT